MEKAKLLCALMILLSFEAKAAQNIDVFEEIKESSKEVLVAQGKQLLIFVSLSMPDNSLKQLMNQVRQYNGTLVIRGLHKGSFKHTIKALHKINKEGVSAVIDPTLFEKYAINSVPTFILKDGDKVDKVVGNVPLSYVLELFKSEGDTGGT